MAGIYLHIPFCKQACYYCDFHFSTSLGSKDAMVSAIVKEIGMQKDYLGNEKVNTIYFGGGTPSLLNQVDLRGILNAIKVNHPVAPDAEITLEANPDDLTREKLDELRSLGVNRLSIGIQSFRDEILTFFNRAHNADESARCLIDARAAGFDNISVDLIYGVPGQDDQGVKENMERALSFNPQHISAYSLTIEERTVFGKWKASNKLSPMDESLVADQFELMMHTLVENGYQHYEISNYSLPGFQSRHNSSYWDRVPYLGLGPSAHSYNGDTRQFNIANTAAYIRTIGTGELQYEREILTQRDKVNEYFFITLRTSKGCDLEFLEKQYDYKITADQRKYIDQLLLSGNAGMEGNILKLTNKGKLLADKISSDLFVSDE